MTTPHDPFWPRVQDTLRAFAHSCPTVDVKVDVTEIAALLLAALTKMEHRIMTELEDLQAAVAAEDTAISALAAEQATFLADIAAKLTAAGIDPALLAPITADITARVADLQALTAAEVAADPGAAPAAAPADAPAAEPTA